MKLVCPECRRENEPQRIYCHDCGAKLDRSKLIKEAADEEQPEEAHKRLKAMFNPRGLKLRQNFFKVSKVVLAALLTATLIQMALPPDVPERPKSLGLSSIGLDLETASGRAGGQPLRYTEQQVNAYLGSTLKNKQAALSGWLTFERATAQLEEEICRVTIERSLFGLPVYTAADFSATLQNGAISGHARAGRIGRLPVHPQLVTYLTPLFADVWTALDRDRKSLSKMGAIELHPQSVTILPRA